MIAEALPSEREIRGKRGRHVFKVYGPNYKFKPDPPGFPPVLRPAIVAIARITKCRTKLFSLRDAVDVRMVLPAIFRRKEQSQFKGANCICIFDEPDVAIRLAVLDDMERKRHYVPLIGDMVFEPDDDVDDLPKLH